MDAKILVPILRSSLEKLRSPQQESKLVLVDGFPRNTSQQREFEEAVSILAWCEIYVLTYQRVVRRATACTFFRLPKTYREAALPLSQFEGTGSG